MKQAIFLDLHRAIADVLEATGITFELILVDDGSTDGTWQAIEALSERDRRVVGLRHRRNFGKARGLATGFAAASGDSFSRWMPICRTTPRKFRAFWPSSTRVSISFRAGSNGARIRWGRPFPAESSTPRCARSPVCRCMISIVGSRSIALTSFATSDSMANCTDSRRCWPMPKASGSASLPVRHHPRRWGTSKYGWSRLIKGFLDLLTVTFLTEYRQRPMHVLGVPGVVALATGGLIGLWLTAEKILTGASIGNRPLLLLAVLLVLVGVQFFGLGLLGELLVHREHGLDNAAASAPIRQVVGLRSSRDPESDSSPPAGR